MGKQLLPAVYAASTTPSVVLPNPYHGLAAQSGGAVNIVVNGRVGVGNVDEVLLVVRDVIVFVACRTSKISPTCAIERGY